MSKRRLLFVCTGNSCRSQMAEGWARHLGGIRVTVESAGTKPAGYVNPAAMTVMQEAGVDISRQTSKVLAPEMIRHADVVVTVCGGADVECPVIPPGVRRLHWPIPDPFHAAGDREAVMRQFRAVRDELRTRVETLLAEINSKDFSTNETT